MKSYKTICIDGKQKRLHRYLIEHNIGRKLESSEIVHHVDGDKHNNNIDNLEVISRGEHLKIHLLDGSINPYLVTKKYDYENFNIKDMFLILRKSAKEISIETNIPESSINYYLRKNSIRIEHREIIVCDCGEEATHKRYALCQKCYMKQYHKKAKNAN